jgi:hypothetical protein
MADLIPNEGSRIVGTDGPWKIWSYRGATVRSWRTTNRLVMPGHPLDGTYLGHHEAWFPIIDHWLDHGDLPPP